MVRGVPGSGRGRGRGAAAAAAPAPPPPPPAAGAMAPPPPPAPAPAPRRRGVVGPTSALTSFLAEMGVQAPRTNFAGTVIRDNPGGSSTNQPNPTNPDRSLAVTAGTVIAGPTEAGEGEPEWDDEFNAEASGSKKKKRGRIGSDDDSDNLDDDFKPTKKSRGSTSARQASDDSFTGPSSAAFDTVLKSVGEFMACSECSTQFTVTNYTKPHPTNPGFMCHDCTVSLGIDPFGKTKKPAAPKKRAGKKEERGKVVSYEEKKGAVTLGDTCIKLIGKHIEDVDALGDMGNDNMEKISKIIAKSRRLNPETATLFYSAEKTDLKLYDCTNLLPASYMTLSSLCPNLTSLRLDLCGRIDTDTMAKWGKAFKHLTRIELDAPFLVRVDGWKKFFQGVGKQLEAFLVIQQPRFDLHCLEIMVKHCPKLTELRLCEFGLLEDSWLPIISKLKNLTSLDLGRPGSQSCSDDAVISLLSHIGGKLEHLNLSRHIDLSDRVLTEGVAVYCPNLVSLCVEDISGNPELAREESSEGLTNAGVTAFFTAWKESGHPGCTKLDFQGCHSLQGESLMALLAHSGKVVTELSISGWKDVQPEPLEEIAKCKMLESLDVSWCRDLSDFAVKDILSGCEEIKKFKVWGCNKLTDAIPRKKGCRVIGIETHTI